MGDRTVLYVAHPLAPTPGEIAAVLHDGDYAGEAPRRALDRNIRRALYWLGWLRRTFPEATFIAPWIATVLSLDGDDSPALREAGLVDDCAVVERCDGIVLCGSRVSSGMQRESAHGRRIYDLTVAPLPEPPFELRPQQPFAEWAALYERMEAPRG